MPCLRARRFCWILAVLPMTLLVQAEDLHLKKNISIDGSPISSSETSVKGARERTSTNSPAGNIVSLRQCDLKRTLTINDQAQTYLAVPDPQDDSAAKTAAMFAGASVPGPASGGIITQSATVTDTGERKQISGYTARHLKTTVLVDSSANACSQVKQKYEIDGWYADLAPEQARCSQSLPLLRQTEGCSDRLVVRRKGTAKPGYPLLEAITLQNEDGTTTMIEVSTADISKQTLSADLFDAPAGYREVKSQAELYNSPQPAQLRAQQQQPLQQVANAAPQPQPQLASGKSHTSPAISQPAGMASGLAGQNAMLSQAQQYAAMAAMPQGAGGQFQGAMPGMTGPATGAAVPLPQVLGPKAPGKIRIGIAPAQAQMGQGNNAQADFGTPIRNAIVYLMNGPAVEVTALDSRLPIQTQAEAQQKQCDYVLFSNVTVKHSGGGGFGKFMKAAGPMSSMVPMIGMAKGVGGAVASQAASVAMQSATQAAQQSALSQLSGFNGQIKSKDDVTVAYQLVPNGQDKPRLENTLKGKAKSDGEDLMTPLIQEAANTILTEVTKK